MNITEQLLFDPEHFSVPAPWAGHIPFANWLISAQNPATFVELGAYSGISYMSFCQAIVQHTCSTQAWAIDTWEGDPHAGFYGEAIYTTLKGKHDAKYGQFSTLLRSTFDSAVENFNDKSIDLLHIDGLHTYEAVRHDFETWKSKLSDRAVVLFHDTNVFQGDFGVHKLWGELKNQYPSINFTHSNGLGVLLVGKNQPQLLIDLCSSASMTKTQSIFARLGERLEARASNLILANQFSDLQTEYTKELEAGKKRHDWILQQDSQLRTLHTQLLELEPLRSQLERVQQVAQQTAGQLQDVYASTSWRWTALLRRAGRRLDKLMTRSRGFKNAFSRLRSVGVPGLIRKSSSCPLNRSSNRDSCIGILTPPHTLFIAELLSKRLTHHGFKVEISTVEPQDFDCKYYFVLAAQIFKRLPPGEKRIVYQLEQSVSNRWFTAEYFDIINNSLAALDYCHHNIEFLAKNGIAYPHVYYLPVGAFDNRLDQPRSTPEFEVLFYGDANSSERRRALLNKLQSHFKVDVVSEVFGDALRKRLLNARLVVNLHYYENALLETPRIQECLSLGIPVVSESAQNQSEFDQLCQVVRYFPVGSADQMVEAIAQALAQPPSDSELLSSVRASEGQFNFLLDRALIGIGLISPAKIKDLLLPLQSSTDLVCLSLPETTERRKLFLQHRPATCEIFDGLRKTPGWIGCGLSYQSLANHAVRHGLTSLTVMEDDVLLPENFGETFERIKQYLHARPAEWDIFAGLIASLHPDTQVLDVKQSDGLTFVTINKMTSMVFNVYSPRLLEVLQSWDSQNHDAATNTIDRHIEQQIDLKVIVALPFFASHREDATSTLWGFSNSQYAQMIRESEQALNRMVADFLKSKPILREEIHAASE